MLAALLIALLAPLPTPLADDEPPQLAPGDSLQLRLDAAAEPLPLRVDASAGDVTFRAQCTGLDIEARFLGKHGEIGHVMSDLVRTDEVWVRLGGGGVYHLWLVATSDGEAPVDVHVDAGLRDPLEGAPAQLLRARRQGARAQARRERAHPDWIYDLYNAALAYLELRWTREAAPPTDMLWSELERRAVEAGALEGLSHEVRQLLVLTLGLRTRLALQRLELGEARVMLRRMAEAREGFEDRPAEIEWGQLHGRLAIAEGRLAEALQWYLGLLGDLDDRPDERVMSDEAWETYALGIAEVAGNLAADLGDRELSERIWREAVARAVREQAAPGALAQARLRRADSVPPAEDVQRLRALVGAGEVVARGTREALATHESRRGHVLEAEALLLEALEDARRHGHRAHALALSNQLVALALDRGDELLARERFDDSLRRVPDADLAGRVWLGRLFNLVRLERGSPAVLGRLTALLADLERSADFDGQLEVLELLVGACHERGDFARALDFATRHEALARDRARPARIAVSLSNLSEIHRAQGQLDAALAAAREGLAHEREGLPWDARLGVLANGVRAALAAGELELAGEVFARGMDVLAEVPGDPDPLGHVLRRADASVSDWLPVAVDVMAARVRAAPDESTRRAALAEGYARHGSLKARVLLEGMLDGVEPVRGVTPDELAAGLAGDEVFVEYLAGTARLHALVVDAQRQQLVDLGERGPLELLVSEYVDGLASDSPLMAWRDVALLGGDLGQRLVAPLGITPGAPGRRLVVAPSGRLASMPFEALVLHAEPSARGAGDVVFLADEFVVVHAPSGSVYAALERGRPRADGRLLAVADPVYGGRGDGAPGLAAALRAAELSRLVETREEVFGIARLLAAEDAVARADGDGVAAGIDEQLVALGRNGRLALPRCELLLGEAVTRGALADAMGGASWLHLAAHGRVDADDPRRTGLVLSGGELLSVPDILELRLDADLAVLSACSTARGAVFSGEGVQSLAQAFLRAGARAVVASLWQVDDASTARLMQDFYAALVEDELSVPLALAHARQRLRDRTAPVSGRPRGDLLPGAAARLERDGRLVADHPHRWAAFVVVGR